MTNIDAVCDSDITSSLFSDKGVIEIGADADILLLDKNTLKLKYVVAKGCVVMTPKWTHAGLFGTGAPEPKSAPTSMASKIPKKGNMCC